MDNLDQTKRELMDEVKGKLIEELNLEEITPEDIDNEAPLFGDEGLGLDSIDALEIILILEREYGIRLLILWKYLSATQYFPFFGCRRCAHCHNFSKISLSAFLKVLDDTE